MLTFPLLVLTVKATLVLFLGELLVRCLASASGAVRHGVLTATLTAVLLLPVLGPVLPAWRIPLLPPVNVESAGFGPRLATSGDWVGQRQQQLISGPDNASALQHENAHGEVDSDAKLRSWTHWLSVLYFTAAAILLFVAAFVRWSLDIRLRRGQTLPETSPAGLILHQLCRDPGRVRLAENEDCPVPLAWGFFRPLIVLPAASRSWGPERLRAVLLHELAHIRRGDAFWHLVAELACAAHWFNPLVWRAARRLRLESEHACDDAVLAGGARPSEYAAELLALSRSPCGGVYGALLTRPAPGMARPHQLSARIDALFDESRGRRPLSASRLTGVVLASVLLVLPWTALAVVPRTSVPLASVPQPHPLELRPVQARWTDGLATSAFFAQGPIRSILPPASFADASDAFFLAFEIDEDGRYRGYQAVPGAGNRLMSVMRDPATADSLISIDDAFSAEALLPMLGEASRQLATFEPDAAPYDDGLSGSRMTGLPATTVDPSADVLQAGWVSRGRRAGVFAHGPIQLSADRSQVIGLAPDAWFVVYTWDPADREFQVLEALPGDGGKPRFYLSANARDAPFDVDAVRWLQELLAELPGERREGPLVNWIH